MPGIACVFTQLLPSDEVITLRRVGGAPAADLQLWSIRLEIPSPSAPGLRVCTHEHKQGFVRACVCVRVCARPCVFRCWCFAWRTVGACFGFWAAAHVGSACGTERATQAASLLRILLFLPSTSPLKRWDTPLEPVHTHQTPFVSHSGPVLSSVLLPAVQGEMLLLTHEPQAQQT